MMTDIFEEPEIEQPVEAEAAPEAAPEAPEPVQEEVEAEAPEEVKEEKTVPLAALNEARHVNRELREKYDSLESQFKKFLDDQRNASRQQAQAQEADEFNRDPLGALQKDLKSLREAQETAQKQTVEQRQQQEQLEQMQQAVAVHIQEFSKDHSDYQDALGHLLETRSQELRLMGIPEQNIAQMIQQESLGIAQTALRTGSNAAEMVYNLAKMRGYATKQAQGDIDRVQKGQAASRSMPSGQAAAVEPSLSDIERMSDSEFEKYWDKFASKQR